MAQMKAAMIYEAGGPEQLKVEMVKQPEVKAGWSLVKVMGFGINHSEIFTRKGESPSVKFPRILGIECVGVVEESTSPNLKNGQKVVSFMGEMGRAYDGGYAQYCLLPNDNIFPIKSNLSWPEIAAIPETYYTAYMSLKNLRINENDKVLVRGATSGVGYAFLKLLRGRYPNINCVGTSRSENKRALLEKVGFDEVIIDQDNVLQTDESFDRILDLIGPAAILDTFKHINKQGIICITGLLGNKWSFDFEPLEELPNSTYLTIADSSDRNQTDVSDLFSYIEKYHVNVKPEKIFSLDDIQEAHRYLESSNSFGKVVVCPN
ncbi:zinc-binding dehydrogenase [Limosilactobacillus mucosae]|uniref:zinc-binding dehydrogenase n=1 Tax=Limosilactobacillus mucosae TaxID=97478 RepID=UPI00233F55C0|nr:zinc-binding dehydrogenase [Limosilactobacillus mucosae]MDC2845667.1 zinc-binding dehydrogenase [Limosilactobacillus mucosae]